jgi:hypothetical protein
MTAKSIVDGIQDDDATAFWHGLSLRRRQAEASIDIKLLSRSRTLTKTPLARSTWILVHAIAVPGFKYMSTFKQK